MYHSFFIHSYVDRHLGCFHVLAIVNSATMNTAVPVSFSVWFPQGICPVVGIAGSYSSFIPSIFKESPYWLCQFTLPPTVQEGSLFSTPSPAFVCGFFDDGHSDQCEVVSHCSFDLHLITSHVDWRYFRLSQLGACCWYRVGGGQGSC